MKDNIEFDNLNKIKKMEEQEYRNDDLKPDINNFLYMNLPGDITLDQCEKIAAHIYWIISYPHEFLNQQEKEF